MVALYLALQGCADGPPVLPRVEDPCAAPAQSGWFTLPVPGWRLGGRPAQVYVPASAGPRDLVVVLHGNNATGREAVEATRMSLLADQEGFAVVAPTGVGWSRTSWNAGSGCCGEASWRFVDDVGYLDALATLARERLCGGRVLAVGFSNGGMMAHRWGCEGETPDALQVASGSLMSDPATCVGEPRPVLVYHGTADTRVPLEGGPGDRGSYVFRSVADSLEVWRGRNRCTSEPPSQWPSGDTMCERWECEASTVLCTVDGLGHTWPGGRNTAGTDADATLQGWRWFQRVLPN